MIMLPGNRIKIPGETRARHCQISGRWRDRSAGATARLERPLAGATARWSSPLCSTVFVQLIAQLVLELVGLVTQAGSPSVLVYKVL